MGRARGVGGGTEDLATVVSGEEGSLIFSWAQ